MGEGQRVCHLMLPWGVGAVTRIDIACGVHWEQGAEAMGRSLVVPAAFEEILNLLKDFSPLHVHRVQSGCKCFAFVDLGSMQKVALAIQELNGKFFHKRKLFVNTNRRPPKRIPDVPMWPQELPVLEKASGKGLTKNLACTQHTPKAAVDPCETEKLRAAFFMVPVEMRGSFLVLLLRECFRDLRWLAIIHSIRGHVGLLVTSVVPQTPFFWAMHITEALHQNMQALFSILAEAEERQPYLAGSAVQRGTRCLAEYHLGDYGQAWNRCWVLDRVDTWAVVMFIDFGRLATISVQSLRRLDSDDFWTIPPLTQPFMLEKDILSSDEVVHRILEGKITGALNLEVTAPVSNLAILPPLPSWGLSGRVLPPGHSVYLAFP
ncbi:tudor domain-containing protein 10 [Carlito syrichta]|uniref:Tudor domain-containing protein 10 n=1 Tax=Carlito syrichta TaxID=1868482 RepID=A0A3Q0DFR1_CARSF|nr:tudor domain-containing protein 10 [Carlito syrichta]